MLKDINLGQYYPGQSVLHKYNPKLKIISVMFFILQLFFIDSFIPYIFVGIFLILATISSSLKFSTVFRGLKPIRWIILVTFVINLLFVGGEEIFRLGPLVITKESLKLASMTSIRILLLVWGTSLLTLTTSPIELTDGLESLMNPFAKIGIPAHEISMMMTIALRFIPTLIEETDKIMKAQKARGADFESGNIIKRAKNLVPLLVPLFISSFRRADELAIAMEARCYRGGENRTRLNELKIVTKDYFVFSISTLFFALIIFTNIIKFWKF